MSEKKAVVLATLDSKPDEAKYVCSVLERAGVIPYLCDLSLRPHDIEGAVSNGNDFAQAAGSSWKELAEMDRNQASEFMVKGASIILKKWLEKNKFSGIMGLGGANGTSMSCAIMRSLPTLMPKVMVSAVAATGAVQWYVAESNIAMFPSIGDFTLNRITRGVLNNAGRALAGMVMVHETTDKAPDDASPLIGISSSGGTAGCVNRLTETLMNLGYEVIHFHASGPGGKALESLARQKDLSAVLDITTHEITDYLVEGVYSAGESRFTAAIEVGLPQIVVPGAIDHSNFWVNQVPDKYSDREFFQYNAQNILMRTNSEEFEAIGNLMADRLNQSKAEFVILIPTLGFSEHTTRKTYDLEGNECGFWFKPEVDKVFATALKKRLKKGRIVELDLHINDSEFADNCLSFLLELLKK